MLSYNENYNPHESPPDHLPSIYSPYDPGEPFYNNRPAKTRRLFVRYIFAVGNIRERTSLVWKIGYTLKNNNKKTKPVIWGCKLYRLYRINSGFLLILLGYHDPKFAPDTNKFYFNTNSLKNTKNYILKHFLDKNRDTWRVKPDRSAAQPSNS
jgi:hypothetical protein